MKFVAADRNRSSTIGTLPGMTLQPILIHSEADIHIIFDSERTVLG
jgi:hypothetical protein